ncbi:hypothetical protein F4861DRAFT_537812 [Xylaria intraflava]|nr:hypothetical protein F4861DRAFT_537812 [Xylaria intraflava]
MLDAYVGQNVIVVGKVMQLRGDSAVLDANGQVNAILNRESHLMAGNGAQIIGRVNQDLSVKVYNAMDLGSDVDFQVAQSVVDATHQYKKLFVLSLNALVPLQYPTLIINTILRLRPDRQQLRVIVLHRYTPIFATNHDPGHAVAAPELSKSTTRSTKYT